LDKQGLGREGRSQPRWALLAVVFLVLAPPLAGAGEGEEAPAERKIRDNLFLLEEAYNQEPGVVQHIQGFQRGDGDWSYSFTDEWPVPGERHQLSLTVPAQSGPPGSGAEWGDVLVNYRWQARHDEGLACAPRISLILPTGNERTGAGRGGLGLQGNLPLSLDLHPRWVLHLNAGLTYRPRAFDPATEGRWRALDTAAGAALVWLPTYRVNGLLEVVHQSAKGGPDGMRESTVTLNPGVRVAVDFKSGLQVVPGFSLPIEVGGGSTRVSALLYLSIEHPVWK
jgi:hypothetical protein